ncbi:Tfp pilus assembly protein PilX [Oceanisphaera litoralis]|uniref:PilX N-terminal domain-containing pilus assembly protein n=1 Tax=Oceanisphaera litoralis TaxID=225144 RepID=UPI00195E5472|nr:PilX N-terminal domain-containing pilus assembly protein [Oceanisphaera litoralis]MBM7456927.1 Tfp pilus assembly protein PilX [Oceanisphaera litoralis]
MNRVNGFTTLTITLLLVSILISVSVFIGKVLVSEKRIALNEIEYRVAFAAAEKGVAEAIAELKVKPLATAVSGSVNASAATASYQASINSTAVQGVREIVSTATLDNGAATTISVQVAESGIFNPKSSGPAAPILVAGELVMKGNFNVVSNPDGAGPGLAVSVWAKGDSSLEGSAKTCGQEGASGGCDKDVVSDSKDEGTDIITGDADFPDDLVEYIFGQPDTEEGWANVEKKATAIVSDCNDPELINGGAGLYIVENQASCKLGSGVAAVGSAAAPLFIIIKNGDLTINGGTKVYGFIFSYDSDPENAPDYDVTLAGGASLNGAILINHDGVKNFTGTFDIIYDPGVTCTMFGCKDGSGSNNGGMKSLGYIPGSWKDW